MKLVITLFFLQASVFAAFANATSFQVRGVHGKVLLQQDITASNESLGQLTDGLLNQAVQQKEIQQYTGSPSDLTSINGLGNANETISSEETKAYGWCYVVDGKLSHLSASEYQLSGKESSIVWYYGYAHSLRNVWSTECTPADHMPN